MEFVPVDAGAEGGLAGWFVVVVIDGGVLGVLVVLFEDAGRVGFGAVHVAVPFAGAAHVCLGKPAVVDEHAFERGVEAAFEPVAVTRHRAENRELGVEETEECAVFEEAFESEIGAAQRQMGPPPSALLVAALGSSGLSLP